MSVSSCGQKYEGQQIFVEYNNACILKHFLFSVHVTPDMSENRKKYIVNILHEGNI